MLTCATSNAARHRLLRAHQRVLLVDDNVDAVDTLAELLRADGFEVQVAYDGGTGLELLETFAPDVIVLDIGLPVIDGYTLATLLRADARFQDVSLIALTAYGSPAHMQRSRECGFDYHLVKPDGFELLRSALAVCRGQGIKATT